MGMPSPSSHSPGPKGIVTGPPELVRPCAPAELASIPLFRSLHSVMVSSITTFVSSSREMSTCRRRRTHSLSCRIQVHGSDQSRRTTTSVSGIELGVRRGLRRGANDSEGSESRYAETRANVSRDDQFRLNPMDKERRHYSYPPGPHPAHPDMCIPTRTGWRQAELVPSASRSTG